MSNIISTLIKLKIGCNTVHESHEAPEGINLVLHNKKDWREKVGHALDVAEVEVVHHVGHQYVLEQSHIGVIVAHIVGMRSVSPADVFFYL